MFCICSCCIRRSASCCWRFNSSAFSWNIQATAQLHVNFKGLLFLWMVGKNATIHWKSAHLQLWPHGHLFSYLSALDFLHAFSLQFFLFPSLPFFFLSEHFLLSVHFLLSSHFFFLSSSLFFLSSHFLFLFPSHFLFLSPSFLFLPPFCFLFLTLQEQIYKRSSSI